MRYCLHIHYYAVHTLCNIQDPLGCDGAQYAEGENACRGNQLLSLRLRRRRRPKRFRTVDATTAGTGTTHDCPFLPFTVLLALSIQVSSLLITSIPGRCSNISGSGSGGGRNRPNHELRTAIHKDGWLSTVDGKEPVGAAHFRADQSWLPPCQQPKIKGTLFLRSKTPGRTRKRKSGNPIKATELMI